MTNNDENDQILVSIICLTYNHANFIGRALDSFLSQKTNFNYEIIVHDDASTDGTTDIIKEYANKSDKIVPIYQTENQWKKSGHISKRYIYPKIRGKYVAYCDGDDYWIDDNKLSTQVSIFEKDKDVTLCFHKTRIEYNDAPQIEPKLFPSEEMIPLNKNPSLSDLLKFNFIQTSSVMYRWKKELIDDIPENILPGDWYLHLLYANIGKIFYIREVMSVYNRHVNSVWWQDNEKKFDLNFYAVNGIYHLNFYKQVSLKFNVNLNNDFYPMLKKTIFSLLVNNKFQVLKQLVNDYNEECFNCLFSEKITNNINIEDIAKNIFDLLLNNKLGLLVDSVVSQENRRKTNLDHLKKEKHSLINEINLIIESGLFDITWYLNKYNDVKDANVDPVEHYLVYGWKEGRDPSNIFSTSSYLYLNEDVKNANINPLIHYIKYGKQEKRRVNL